MDVPILKLFIVIGKTKNKLLKLVNKVTELLHRSLEFVFYSIIDFK